MIIQILTSGLAYYKSTFCFYFLYILKRHCRSFLSCKLQAIALVSNYGDYDLPHVLLFLEIYNFSLPEVPRLPAWLLIQHLSQSGSHTNISPSLLTVPSSCPSAPPMDVAWVPPVSPFVKINVHCLEPENPPLNGNTNSVGVIIRDSEGQMLWAAMGPRKGMNAVLAELWSIHGALVQALTLDRHKIHVEIYNRLVFLIIRD